MTIPAQQIKELRDRTRASISDVKKALEESAGDIENALKIIGRKLGATALKKAGRETRSGLIDAYVHSTGRVASVVELFCETDFVARNPSFKELAHNIALHVAAMNPAFLSLETVPKDIWEEEKSRFEVETQSLNKPPHVIAEIVEGKLKSYFGERSLLNQQFVKDPDKTVGDVLKEAIGRFGENLRMGKFTRWEI